MENSSQAQVIVIGLVFTFLQVCGFLFTTWYTAKRIQPQNRKDDSDAFQNFQETIVSQQAERKAMQEEMRNLRAILERAHLEIALDIKIGEQPTIKYSIWKKSEEVTRPIFLENSAGRDQK